ncbi:FAD-dependent oxidoreductase [Nocardioides sp.]|jgi:2-polyprenyl-6-methoxyphenol hydroxylase-like FAD-dependent oxidoreductase|uniref:FAD-dependent oxidoreductase n=1 Tax=Nocardioides sp. TaxID=35761 RepID=UPI002F40073D
MHVAVIGAGPAGLFLGAALARRGHRVTAVDRDPGPSGSRRWDRRGVMQFHHAHAFRQTVADALAREVPDAMERWLELGAEPIRGGMPGAPESPMGHRSKRETFERALHVSACETPGFELLTGHVDAVVQRDGAAAGVVIDGSTYDADLVVDASGRNGRVTRQLGERAGVGGPCGQAYVDRVYRLRPGAEPGPMTSPIAWQADCEGYLCLLFPHERGLFSVVIVRATDDPALRDLRHAAAFTAAARAIPGLDAWTDPERAEPVTDVLPGGPLLNVYRGQCTEDGNLVLPGLVFVGDSVATTTPAFGRGITTTLWQCEALLSLLDHDADDLAGLGVALDDWGADLMRPWVEDHIHIDTDRVARWSGRDVDLDAPLPSDLILDAARVRPEIMESAGGYLSMAALPATLREAEPIAREVYAGGWRRGSDPGPSRVELAEIVAEATQLSGTGSRRG